MRFELKDLVVYLFTKESLVGLQSKEILSNSDKKYNSLILKFHTEGNKNLLKTKVVNEKKKDKNHCFKPRSL